MKVVTSKSAFATMSDLIMALSQIEQQREPLIDETFHQRLVQSQAALRAAVNALDEARTAKRHAIAAHHGHGDRMKRSVRDFHGGLKRAAKRDPAAQIWQEVFSLKHDLPSTKSLISDWFEQARQIAEAGEAVSAKLVADELAYGAPMPSSPSSAEVAVALTQALDARQTYLLACAGYKQAEEAVRTANEQCQRLLTGLRKRLTALFHELSPEMRRVEMSKYGVRYKAASPQVVTDDPATTPSEKPLAQSA